MLAAKFARHHRVETMMTYIHMSKNELYESIERAQDERLLKKIKKVHESLV